MTTLMLRQREETPLESEASMYAALLRLGADAPQRAVCEGFIVVRESPGGVEYPP